MADKIKERVDSYAQMFSRNENGEIHITVEDQKKVIGIWGSDLWATCHLSAREVRQALEYTNDKYFTPQLNVNQFNTIQCAFIYSLQAKKQTPKSGKEISLLFLPLRINRECLNTRLILNC